MPPPIGPLLPPASRLPSGASHCGGFLPDVPSVSAPIGAGPWGKKIFVSPTLPQSGLHIRKATAQKTLDGTPGKSLAMGFTLCTKASPRGGAKSSRGLDGKLARLLSTSWGRNRRVRKSDVSQRCPNHDAALSVRIRRLGRAMLAKTELREASPLHAPSIEGTLPCADP